MAIYSAKQDLELRITKKLVAKLSMEDGVPSDDVVEACCLDADAMVLSKIAQFYSGSHPILAPSGLAILSHAAVLYAISYLCVRDPTLPRTYIDVSKDPRYMQAEKIMSELQTDSRCLYDNPSQPFLGAGTVSPSAENLNYAPRLFTDDYRGDL